MTAEESGGRNMAIQARRSEKGRSVRKDERGKIRRHGGRSCKDVQYTRKRNTRYNRDDGGGREQGRTNV